MSLYFEVTGNKEKSRFVGQWVSPFLLLGVYNKLVKVMNAKENESREKNLN